MPVSAATQRRTDDRLPVVAEQPADRSLGGGVAVGTGVPAVVEPAALLDVPVEPDRHQRRYRGGEAQHQAPA